MSTILIAPAPKNTPMLVGGRFSDVWLAWLNSITTTGGIVQDLQALQAIAEDNSTDGNTAAILAELLDALALLAAPGRAPEAIDQVAIESQPRDMLPALDELRQLVASALEAQANAWREEASELRALLAAGDPAPFGALASVLLQQGGVSGTITIPKLTTANGSITVVNGLITAFVNPT